MMTKAEVEKLINQKIPKEKEEIYRKMAQAFADNNTKLFNELVMKSYADEHYVSHEEHRAAYNKLQTTMDKIYGIVRRMDEEQTVVSHQVNNHEVRITHIESALAQRANLRSEI